MVKFLIQRPIAVTVILIAFLVMSLVAAKLIPVSLMPEIDIPEIVVKIDAKGKPAREVEEQILSKIRRQLLQVSHLSDIESLATSGQGSVRLIYNYGTNINYAFIEVNEKIDALMHSLPGEYKRPRVIKTSATDIPVFYLNISLKDSLEGNRFMELSQFCEQVIKKRVEQLPEVAMADISGLEYPEMVLKVDMDKLNLLGIDRTVLVNALEANNYSVGNIKVRSGLYEYNVRYASLLKNRTDIENLNIKAGDRIFRLKDLTEINIRPEQQKGVYLSGNSRAVVLAVIKKTDARIADLKEETKELILQLQHDYPRLKIEIERNQTELLDYSLGNLKIGLIVGGLMAFFIMFLFLKDMKSPFLIGISVPLSLVVSLLMFYLTGLSVNVVSLSGLILGVGMMIDNSIIVIDNITQYRDKGYTVFKSCIKGTNEVIRPLISSVLTTCAVFVPLIFLSGISGALFYDQALAVAIGLSVSLVVSVTVIPVYFRLIYSKSNLPSKKSQNRLRLFGFYRNIEDSYSRGFDFVFRYHKLFFTFSFLLIMAGYFVFVNIEKEKFPVFKQQEAIFNIDWNRNITVNENQKRIEKFIKENTKLIENSSCMIGSQDFLLDISENLEARASQLYLKANNENDLGKVIEAFESYCRSNYKEANFEIIPPPTLFEKVFNNRSVPLEIRLRNKDGVHLPEAKMVQDIIERIKEETGNVVQDRLKMHEYYNILPDYERMLLYKVPVNEVISELKKALNQLKVFTLQQGQFEVPVFLSGTEKPLEQIIQSVKVKSDNNDFIPLSSLVKVDNAKDYSSINGGKSDVFIPLKYEVSKNEADVILSVFEGIIKEYPQLEYELRGSLSENKSLLSQMFVILLVSLLLLYFILAAQFESLLQPLIVLLEIPIDIAGALILLWITGNSLNLMAFIGIIVITGIIINDSILKIDTINRLTRNNVTVLEAIHSGGKRRLKPIIMTSATTILAMIPFLFGNDLGSRLQQPLAIVTIGGMFIGTLVSLYFIPLCYYYLYRIKG